MLSLYSVLSFHIIFNAADIRGHIPAMPVRPLAPLGLYRRLTTIRARLDNHRDRCLVCRCRGFRSIGMRCAVSSTAADRNNRCRSRRCCCPAIQHREARLHLSFVPDPVVSKGKALVHSNHW